MAGLEIRISKDGQKTTIEGVDCTGEMCHILSRPFEEALGEVEDVQNKPEYYVELDGEQVYVGEE